MLNDLTHEQIQLYPSLLTIKDPIVYDVALDWCISIDRMKTEIDVGKSRCSSTSHLLICNRTSWWRLSKV